MKKSDSFRQSDFLSQAIVSKRLRIQWRVCQIQRKHHIDSHKGI